MEEATLRTEVIKGRNQLSYCQSTFYIVFNRRNGTMTHHNFLYSLQMVDTTHVVTRDCEFKESKQVRDK